MERLLLITSDFLPATGGVARYYGSLVRGLPTMVVVTSVAGVASPQVERTRWDWPFWPRWLPLLWRVPKWQRQFGTDVVAAGQLLPIGTALWLLHLLRGQAYVVFVHGLDVTLSQRNAWKKFLAKQVLRRAKFVVANSEFTKSLAETAGATPQHTAVVYPSLDLPMAVSPEALDELRRRHRLEGKLVLLTVARLVQRKGIERVLSILPQLGQEFPNLAYVVVGSGPEGERLKQLAVQQNLPVVFVGGADDQALAAWYLLCDVFVLTPEPDPVDVEGFGIAYLEAQAAGKPVVATRVAGVPEAVGEGGVLVQTDQELLAACGRLLRDQAERVRLGAIGQKRVTQFTPAAQVAALRRFLYGN